MNDVITFESEEFGKVGTITINDNPYDNGKNVDELFINTYFDDAPEEMKQVLRNELRGIKH